MKPVVICTASRSERALQKPLIDCFGESCSVLELPVNAGEVAVAVYYYLKMHGRPKVVFCSFDRPEMLSAAYAFFLNGVPVAQYHAGDYGSMTIDDTIRNCITLLSTYQFCNGKNSFDNCVQFLISSNMSTEKCYEVGSMVFDGVVLDDSVVPKDKYDLVVYNPPLGVSSSVVMKELEELVDVLDKNTIWIDPNEDANREVVRAMMFELKKAGFPVMILSTLPRAQYLALLKNADRVIGNSSSFYFELPYFGKKHIHMGVRNSERNYASPEQGASYRMYNIIKNDLGF